MTKAARGSAQTQARPADDIAALMKEIRACRVCRDAPQGAPLPHEPRPVARFDHRARILVVGQAPGTRVHASGLPFDDPSGDRLRDWLGVDRDTFYNQRIFAFAPMGFCFPGLDANGGDLPPRRECAPLWQSRVSGALTELRIVLLVGSYAQRNHLGRDRGPTLTATVQDFHRIIARDPICPRWPLPHPSWRNSSWLKKNTWFSTDLLPELKLAIARAIPNTP